MSMAVRYEKVPFLSCALSLSPKVKCKHSGDGQADCRGEVRGCKTAWFTFETVRRDADPCCRNGKAHKKKHFLKNMVSQPPGPSAARDGRISAAEQKNEDPLQVCQRLHAGSIEMVRTAEFFPSCSRSEALGMTSANRMFKIA